MWTDIVKQTGKTRRKRGKKATMNEEEKKRVEAEEEEQQSNQPPIQSPIQPEGVESHVESNIESNEVPTEGEGEGESEEVEPESDPEPIAEEVPTEGEPVQPEKMLTQSQVNELVGRARQEGRESAMRELYGRYGVSSDEEMNDVFGRGQTYAALDDEYNKQKESMVQLMTENALLKSNIDAARWDDVKYILKGKGYEVTPENIEAEIASHPEWRTASVATASTNVEGGGTVGGPNQPQPQPQQQQAQQPPTVLRRLGSEATVKDDVDTEEDRVRNLFGM